VVKAQKADILKKSREHNLLMKEFIYDKALFDQENEKKEQLKLKMQVKLTQLTTLYGYAFSELFIALMHLKVMRTYIDGILRFGIPPKFYLGLVEPARGREQQIINKMTEVFMDPNLRAMFGVDKGEE